MGFRALRVINEDRVAPGRGFGTHPHEDMEIVTYVLEGGLTHRDSLGTGSTLRPGELQRMTAGTGITHSEFNASPTEPVHLYQIWLLPEREGLEPSYEQKAFPEEERHNRLRLVASPDGRDGSLTIRQDAAPRPRHAGGRAGRRCRTPVAGATCLAASAAGRRRDERPPAHGRRRAAGRRGVGAGRSGPSSDVGRCCFETRREFHYREGDRS